MGDGSELTFLKSLQTHFEINKHNTYTTGLISCLYDVELQIPINYKLSNKTNERSLLIDQFQYLKKNDILIADSGFYSNEVINKLFSNNINFIFRLKKNYLNVKKMINDDVDCNFFNYDSDINKKVKIIKYTTYECKNNEILKYDIDDLHKEYMNRKKSIERIKTNINNLLNEKKILLKQIKNINDILKMNKNNNNIYKTLELDKKEIIKQKNNIKHQTDFFYDLLDTYYKSNKITTNKIKLINKINDSTYYIITNKIDYTIDKIKSLYKKRWEIETHFRFCKDKFKFRNMDSKHLHIINQNILITQFIFILEGYIEFLLSNQIKKNNKCNKSSVLDLMDKYIIKFFLISKNNKKNVNKILKILELIIKSVISKIIIKYDKPRIKCRPSSKWINT